MQDVQKVVELTDLVVVRGAVCTGELPGTLGVKACKVRTNERVRAARRRRTERGQGRRDLLVGGGVRRRAISGRRIRVGQVDERLHALREIAVDIEGVEESRARGRNVAWDERGRDGCDGSRGEGGRGGGGGLPRTRSKKHDTNQYCFFLWRR